MNFKNHFLIAMPCMADERFKKTVIYMCEHTEEGAMGLIINRPLEINVGDMLEQIELEPVSEIIHPKSLTQPVYFGGPVSEDRGFVLHNDPQLFSASISLDANITLTTSKDLLCLLGTHEEPEKFIIVLGYAGWGAGQLEQELALNSWLTTEADPSIIFNTPFGSRWEKALRQFGINPLNLSSDIGHA